MGIFNKNNKPEEGKGAPGTIRTESGTTEKKISKSETVKVKFLKDHGTFKEGDKTEYHISTAEALVAHKVVEIK